MYNERFLTRFLLAYAALVTLSTVAFCGFLFIAITKDYPTVAMLFFSLIAPSYVIANLHKTKENE
ncbi:hypothetical protein AHIS1_p010 [Acaryochloris phage A-HIS1]|nr:hypothetical protein AHIS1_p010 [Acaryochloris phage A-HIS1]